MSERDGAPPRLWSEPGAGRLMGRGHAAGDFLEAWDWRVIERRDGLLRVLAPLPDHLRNPRRQLFGGFTGAYVDLIALHTFWAGREPTPGRPWLTTLNMRIDYYAPVLGPVFELDSRVVNRRGSMIWIETRFLARDAEAAGLDAPAGDVLVYGYTTLKALD